MPPPLLPHITSLPLFIYLTQDTGSGARTAMDLAKEGSFYKETMVHSEGHTACVALLEEAMQQVSHSWSVVAVPTTNI